MDLDLTFKSCTSSIASWWEKSSGRLRGSVVTAEQLRCLVLGLRDFPSTLPYLGLKLTLLPEPMSPGALNCSLRPENQESQGPGPGKRTRPLAGSWAQVPPAQPTSGGFTGASLVPAGTAVQAAPPQGLALPCLSPRGACSPSSQMAGWLRYARLSHPLPQSPAPHGPPSSKATGSTPRP